LLDCLQKPILLLPTGHRWTLSTTVSATFCKLRLGQLMPSQRFTDKWLRGLKAPSIGQVDYWYKLLSGFGVRVGTTGRTSFFVATRINGNYKRITLKPSFPALELAEARKRAQQIIIDAHAGIGPELRKKREAKATFGSVAESFMTDYASKHRTRDEMQRMI